MIAIERIGREHGAFYTAAELVDTDFAEPRWAVHGLIPEGLTLLAGAPKLGKSWLALGMAVAFAGATPVLGSIDTTPGPVLYAALEDTPRRLKSRLQKLVGHDRAPNDLAITTMLPEMPRAVELIAEWLDANRSARLVVVDVLGKIRPPQGSSADRYENDYRVIGALKKLADNYSVAVVVVTHTRKMADGDVFNTVSGSTGLTGAADTTLVLQRARNAETAALHVTGRDVEESEYALTFNATTGAWSLDGSALAEAAARAAELRVSAGLGDTSAEVLAIVGRHPAGITPKDVALQASISSNQASVYLGRLAEAGRIEKAGRGVYTPVVTVGSVVATRPDDGATNSYNAPNSGCRACGEPMFDLGDGESTHPTCGAAA